VGLDEPVPTVSRTPMTLDPVILYRAMIFGLAFIKIKINLKLWLRTRWIPPLVSRTFNRVRVLYPDDGRTHVFRLRFMGGNEMTIPGRSVRTHGRITEVFGLPKTSLSMGWYHDVIGVIRDDG